MCKKYENSHYLMFSLAVLSLASSGDFLFIYMKLNKFGKTSQLHFKLYIQKRKHKRAPNIVSLNKCDSIRISYGVLGQLQV